MCGNCCRGHRLPLTVDEAIRWLRDGHPVELLSDAAPWVREPDADDLPGQHRRRRSFAAHSGSLPVRVTVILTAALVPACPYLLADNRCSNHAQRPLVCRIYPAEINPFVTLDPAGKLCPPEAWGAEHPVLVRQGSTADAVVAADIARSRDTDSADTLVKARACAALGLTRTALGNEGFVIQRSAPAQLLAALEAARLPGAPAPDAAWSFVTNRRSTAESLTGIGAHAAFADGEDPAGFAYLGFQPAAP